MNCWITNTGVRTIRRRAFMTDTGWTFGELGNVRVQRVTDVKVLDAPVERVKRRGLNHREALPEQVSVYVVKSQRGQRAGNFYALS